MLPGVACDEVTLPAWRGEIGVLPGHTPLIALLGIGVVGVSRRSPARDASPCAAASSRSRATPCASWRTKRRRRTAIDAAKAAAEKADAESRRARAAGDEELDAANADARFAEARLAVLGRPDRGKSERGGP